MPHTRDFGLNSDEGIRHFYQAQESIERSRGRCDIAAVHLMHHLDVNI